MSTEAHRPWAIRRVAVPGSRNDEAEVVALLDVVAREVEHDPYPAPTHTMLRSCTLLLVAEGAAGMAGRPAPLLGYLAVHVPGLGRPGGGVFAVTEATIASLAVRASFRGQGIGRALVCDVFAALRDGAAETAIRQRLANLGHPGDDDATNAAVAIATVRVQTLADRDSPAWSLYESTGFRTRRNLPRYYPPAAAADAQGGGTAAKRDAVELVRQCGHDQDAGAEAAHRKKRS